MENELEQIETWLRKEWWLNHGHSHIHLYGDDGEMQCQKCFIDFKRLPLVELRELTMLLRSSGGEFSRIKKDEHVQRSSS